MLTPLWSSVWQRLTLTNFAPQAWGASSYLYRLIGLLKTWRQGSLLLQWTPWIGLLMLLSVFVMAPFSSTTLIGILLIACAGFWIILTVSDPVRNDVTPIHVLVALYWMISVIATAASPVKMAALDGLIKLTLYMLFFALSAKLLRSPQLRSWLITAYLHVALLVSAAGIRQWYFGADALATWVDPDSSLAGTTRVYSFLGNPNLLAGYLIPSVIFSAAAIVVWKHWMPKALAVVMLCVNSACLILTFSRGGWIGFVSGGFICVLLFAHWWSRLLPQFWRRLVIPAVLGLSAAVVVFAVATVDPIRDRVASIFVGRNDSSNNFRINVWMSVLEMIRDRPILGIGPGNDAFNKIYPFYQQPGYTALSAYSILLEVLVEVGVVGFSCFLWLLLVTFNQGWVQLQRLRAIANTQGFWLMAAIATMVGMLMHGLVDTVWYRPQISTVWWLLVALVASFYQPISQTETTSSENPPLIAPR